MKKYDSNEDNLLLKKRIHLWWYKLLVMKDDIYEDKWIMDERWHLWWQNWFLLKDDINDDKNYYWWKMTFVMINMIIDRQLLMYDNKKHIDSQ